MRHRFAGLVDHGQLLAYASDPVIRRGPYAWHRAEISESHALRAIADGELQITTPAGDALRFRYERHIEHPNGDWTWIGRLDGAGDGSERTILTFGAAAAFGSIGQPGQEPLRLTIRDGVAWLVETDRAMLAAGGLSGMRPRFGDDVLIPPPLSMRRGSLRTIGTASAPASTTTTTAASVDPPPATVVDLVLGYTVGYTSALGSTSAVNTRLNFVVDVTNEGYRNSQINATLRLVKTLEVSYPDATNNATALEELTGYRNGVEITPPAAFAALRAARDQYGADLVSLVRAFRTPENDGCGITWLIGGDLQPVTQADEFFGYSVVGDGVDVNETENVTYFCRDETLAHELGHNMGAAHDPANATSPGAFPYSYGFKTTSTTGNFYTIMAYGDSGQASYRIFSNPRSTFCGGRACGTSQADNSQTLTRTIPTIASFRSTVVTVVKPALRDVDGDGRSDFLLFSPGANLFGWWRMNGATPVQKLSAASPGSGFVPVAAGDFNGDRKTDPVWFNSSTRKIRFYMGNGSVFVFSSEIALSAGWNIVGAGDVNGNGKSDLLLHHPATARFAYWLMDSGTIVGSGTISGVVGSGASLVGSGDLNADGKADLVWTNAARQTFVWIGNGSTFVSTQILGYPSTWTLVGLADINADGKSDLLLHNASGNLFGYWRMNGTAITLQKSMPALGQGYVVAAYGDYNADGKADLVWTSPTVRNLYMWLGNGSTFTSALFGSYPSTWQPAPPANR